MKIVIIGPAYPYKGGIAHYTSLMTQTLSKKHDVTLVSFSLQYPKILYPRSSQKDYENTTFKIDSTNYLINTINPFSWVKTTRFIKKIKPDLVIFQWWHPFFTPCYWSISKLIRKHYKIIFLCHNVYPHEKFPLQRILTRKTFSNGNAFIVNSELDEQDLLSIIPDADYIRTVLPTFNAFRLTNIDQAEARKKLNISSDAKILLFFGFVREYKGLKHLLNAMPKIVEILPDCKLLIVGDIIENEKGDYLSRIKQTGCEDNIILVSDYVPDKEVEYYFSACNLVVLPYESATQSGIVQIAYGFTKPVIVTDVGGLSEVVTDGKIGYVIPPFDCGRIAAAVIDFFKNSDIKNFEENIKAEEYKFSWDRMSEIIDKLRKKIDS